MEDEDCDHGKNRGVSSLGGETELGDAESESSGQGVEMGTSEADDTELESTPLVSGRLYQLLRAAEAAYTARVLLMFRPPLTVFGMVPISSLLHCAPGKQGDLLSTSPDLYARLCSKDVCVLKRDGRKTLPKQA